MQRVETYILTKNKDKASYLALVELCHKSKNLYNYVNYILRQCISNKLENIKEFEDLIVLKKKTIKSKDGLEKEYIQNLISEFGLSKRLSDLKQNDYVSLKSQCSQQIIKNIFKNYKSFYKANSEYFKTPSKFKGRPKLPNYKDKNGLNILIYTNQSSTINKNGYLKLSKDFILKSVKTNLKKNEFQQVRIIPKLDYFQIELVYNKIEGEYSKQAKLKNKHINNAAIDIGVDNLATITSDNEESIPLIINGRPLKSINQFYNKKLAEINQLYSTHKIHTGHKLRKLNFKRTMKINDYLHKASRRIVDWCILNNIKTVYIGHNNRWKQNCRIGKINNQKFIQIPFNILINQLKYKLEDVGINVEIINEAYSSKCSFLDNESVEKHYEYLGKRIKRGLFQTKKNKIINADVNGSYNILKLGLKKDFKVKKCFNPIKIKNINEICDVAYFNWQPTDRGSVLEPYTINSIKGFK
jgi:putative transposase